MTVAIHWMPLIASMEQSVGNIGKVLLMAGQSECFQNFMSAEENELFDTVQTHCPEMPLHYRTANDGPDVSDHRTAYPSILFARAHRSRPSLPAIYRAIRTAIRDGPYSTDDPSRACLLVPGTDVSCWCEDCMHDKYSDNIESIHPVSAAIERNLSS
ncbi:hypothetical protein PTSG_08724 [Salpingoeca rosetta]|uniref:Uncharacterized protein n=1 Tax=Salpingoeca rosetta (strain ATCC 50818 / BSB-021) TaxID=946362 RepID=F2UKI1_SALR5|nr:uncharacterized protein PTSG_08724 [Salpingoeca rosetta]EGD77630.1 hypothetical protein PTSG_08724 [Salpingoeca rosetta]|eukprot:XP_004990518.1 hypothetical protein PTSG_08724 [Salpingoeca rosetta]